MAFNYYPKNWHANGMGWYNPAAMQTGWKIPPPSAPRALDAYSTGSSSSGVSSACPYPTSGPSGMPTPHSAYGFVMPPPLPQMPGIAPPAPLYPPLNFEGSGGPGSLSSIGSMISEPNIPPVVPPTISGYGLEEIPCAAIKVPEDQFFFSLGERGSGLRSRGDVQDFHTLRQQCLASGTLFEDPEFPASDSSLMFSRRPDRYVEWLRPMEITSDPQFFVEGYSRFDVQQGELGDCWLLAAAANLTQDPKLFFRVVPEDQNFSDDYAGIFHFRFWQYGRWIDVVIDDRLPTYRGELLYMHSTEKNEFWSALLEKAYAKLHGSYEALKGGTTCEAMEDFTGGVTEMYDLKEAPPNLYSILLKGMERNSMMGCSLEPDPHVLEAETSEGLIRGHAYSITKVQMVDIVTPNTSGKIPLLRLRNPWGNDAEWNGPWSDQSPEWRYIPDHVKEQIGLNFDVDGEFWMSFKDFLTHFDRVELCNLSPDSLSEDQVSRGKKKWEMSVFEGEWTPGVTAGGCRNYLETFWHNPQYVITLEDPDEDDDEGKCTVIIALMQKNRRSRRNMGMDCLTIGFAVYHLSDRDLMNKPQRLNFFKYNASVARSPAFINLREVSCRFKLPPGHYLIVPSTFDPNEEGEFLIRVFSEGRSHMEENDEQVGMGSVDDRVTPSLPQPTYPDPQKSAMEKLFMEVAGADMEVDWMELKQILDHSMKDVMDYGGFSKDVCRSMVAMLDVDQSGKLGFEEFKTLLNDIAKWKAVFKLYDQDGSGKLGAFELRQALNSAGYQLNNRILNALAHRYGSRDGKIAFDDFIMCAVKIKTMIDIFKERDVDGTNMATFSMEEWVEKTVYS
ncbi:calpain-B-like isoform X4 [Phlebotomus papatasi]|uniref:calpain-B-like isoform X4 n=1 Tax=Phlebotomus papatasi TaxID=29031 RepID=UPI002483D836|nr:calpain-B-like isoform X4 [Phlebotomus papatasi]